MISIKTIDALKFREDARLNGKIIATIPKGFVFHVADGIEAIIGNAAKWVQVVYGGVVGYINAEWVTFDAPYPPETNPNPIEPAPGSPVTWEHHITTIEGYKATIEKQYGYIAALRGAQETLRKVRVVLSEDPFND